MKLNSIFSVVLKCPWGNRGKAMADHRADLTDTGIIDNSRFNKPYTRGSKEFYRNHLNHKYNELLLEARVSFILWCFCLIFGLGILVVAIVMFFQGKWIAGSISMISEALVYYIHNIFKIREEQFRVAAESKTEHLHSCDDWSLAMETAEAITDSGIRNDVLADISQAMIVKLVPKDSRPN